MSGRDAVLAKVRSALRAVPGDMQRANRVAERLASPPKGVIPARGQLPEALRVALFCDKAEGLAATVARVGGPEAVPHAVADYLRNRNLAPAVRMGADPRLAALPWQAEKSLQILHGPSAGNDEVGLSHAFGGVAETGTLVLASGPDNPTTLNFLPEHHIVVLDAADVAGDLETVLGRLRDAFGSGNLPRTVNLISGPSRSGDIDMKIILGAHGPRALHIIVVER